MLQMDLIPIVLCLLTAASIADGSSLAFPMGNRALVNAGGCPSSSTSGITLSPGDYSTFTSPNYPDNYSPLTMCIWKFRTSGDSKLRLKCPSVSLGLLSHVVVIADGTTKWYKCVLCTNPLSIDQTFTSQEVVVQFSNSFLFTARGFSCTIVANTPGQNCTCGTSVTRRIVGGTNAQEGEFPWMVGVVNRGQDISFCGGVLITSRHVLTAAHCTRNPDSLELDVRLGMLDETVSPPTGERRQVLEIINQPNYNDQTYDYDISILRIEEVDFDVVPTIKPACLPLGQSNLVGEDVVVSGWGALSAGGQFPPDLRKVTVPVVSNADCTQLLGLSATITDRMFCAGDTGRDSCQGDSGGPAVLRRGTYYELVGIVSFGRGCGEPDLPGVYTRVSSVLQWIHRNTATGDVCSRP